jgi:hypothetical protein
MDSDANEIIYSSKSVEEVAGFTDKLKVGKRFS